MALIHQLTCEWRELKNMPPARSFDGMLEMLGHCPCDRAFIQVSETSSSEEGRAHQLNSSLNYKMNNQTHLPNPRSAVNARNSTRALQTFSSSLASSTWLLHLNLSLLRLSLQTHRIMVELPRLPRYVKTCTASRHRQRV